MEEGWNFEVTKNVISNPPIFLPELTSSTNFLFKASSYEPTLRKKDKFSKK